MRKSIFLLVAILAITHQVFAGKKLKVLFIGNSYTYVNNLPQVIADIAASTGDTLLFDNYTVGGYSFLDHSLDAHCAAKIKSGQWDYVVLQEQSLIPAYHRSDFFQSYYYAAQLDTMIEANDVCTKVIFYMTWGYKNGFAPSCADTSWPYPCSYEGMDSLINLRYRTYADTTDFIKTLGLSSPLALGYAPIRPSLISPVGAVRHYIRHHYPTIELYQADESHPSEAGTYAGACSFYVTLFRKDPTLISYNYTLSSTDAGNIKNAAKLIVYDSLSEWHIGIDLRAQFTYSISTPNTVLFTNTSTSATTYLWDFGDGNNSAVTNPSHTYAGSGIYLIKLVASNASCTDTTFAVINTSATAIENAGNPDPGITTWPNPTKDILKICASKSIGGPYQLYIMNALGQVVYSKENISANAQINISNLNSGIYFIAIHTNGSTIVRRKFQKL